MKVQTHILRGGDVDIWEEIDGVEYEMYSGTAMHQLTVGNLLGEFYKPLKGTSSQVLQALCDVVLEVDGNVNIVHPDLIVVCDPSKIHDDGVHGVPDVVVEVLGRDTAVRDRTIKLSLYERAQVPEYWIVDPLHWTVEVFTLKDSKYGERHVYGADDSISVDVLDGLTIQLQDVFREPFE